MISIETAERLAKLEKKHAELKRAISIKSEQEERGALRWNDKARILGEEARLAKILPILRSYAEAGSEELLSEALDEVEGKKEQLVTRKRVNWTISNDVVDMLKKLSEETGTPISRLIDRAVLEVYGKR